MHENETIKCIQKVCALSQIKHNIQHNTIEQHHAIKKLVLFCKKVLFKARFKSIYINFDCLTFINGI